MLAVSEDVLEEIPGNRSSTSPGPWELFGSTLLVRSVSPAFSDTVSTGGLSSLSVSLFDDTIMISTGKKKRASLFDDRFSSGKATGLSIATPNAHSSFNSSIVSVSNTDKYDKWFLPSLWFHETSPAHRHRETSHMPFHLIDCCHIY